MTATKLDKPDLAVVNTALRLGANFLFPDGTVVRLGSGGLVKILYHGRLGEYCATEVVIKIGEDYVCYSGGPSSVRREHLYGLCEVVELPVGTKPMSEWEQAG